ncbi:glycosyl hydrolase 2 galactose-binding domain-containing protein [Acidipila rosea]|uniref:Beta-galactosidase/beta-glucuronidase n=1 Tax=Acidipila rosea TaxID=768535 RepID=A0A4R1LA80_9BACT|nr:LamG-like jellyroll fold domain-containing protein [Acidipila rosea]TCK75316.1 beta-galactosidase/beta-glucuronidase [Acidipila rosea]
MTLYSRSVARMRCAVVLSSIGAILFTCGVEAKAQQTISVPTLHLPQPFLPLQRYGPYNAHILVGGRGLTKTLPAKDPILNPTTPWTLSAWIEFAPISPSSALIAGVGDPSAEDSRFFALVEGRPAFRAGKADLLLSAAPFSTKGWHFLAATFDGSTTHFYVDGVEQASGALRTAAIAPELVMAPVEASCAKLPCPHFGGRIAQFTLARGVSSPDQIAALAHEKPDPELIEFEEGSKPWAVQVVQYTGNTAPQEPWTMPQRNAPFSKPLAAALPPAQTTLAADAPGDWVLRGGWKLAEAPKVSATPEAVSTAGFDTAAWMPATVPGTVLTTMIDRGRYPDPDYGLNNLDIPERLNKQDYWYRAEFVAPKKNGSSHVSLVLDGINYHAEVWLNGQHLGAMTGAFTRGVFDVSKVLHGDGKNALAIRISPVPHPGIPNVQSIILGSGLNGGAMELDGPTFVASEGWDWNPPMHDRDTGLWQNVHLIATGPVSIGDQQVVTHLPLPDITQADVTLNVPLNNATDKPVEGTLTASFEGCEVRKRVTVLPGGATIQLTPKEFAALHLEHPRLWWPNGYGKPELYHLTTTFTTEGAAPVVKKLQFGVREVSYEISLLDNEGALRRVDYDPTVGRSEAKPQVDVTHEGMRQVPDGWAASIAAGKDGSPAFHTVNDTRATPYLTIKVNGVRIAVRGGSWGMDDSRKRVSRGRLEPFFRYDRDANLNIIRNWQGQNTEDVFYDLADEYGMLVWNDFWEVTMDSNAEAEDPQLFLANAKDTILRYRNHPSIVMWCGRNEGVPQPIINKGLIALTHSLDGTRYYSPSSNQVNLQPSGPYSYEDPADYYTKLDRGFAVEVGTPSLPTLEWFDRWIPKVDRWPITDDWAYHNWHPHDELNQHMAAQFGMAGSLKDYVRQAQMMNYVDYRAIFEGFNAHLWAPNSGRLLWMTQPSWPSMIWGILTSDYDTQASYYGTKKACEPVHVQLELATNDVQVINTTREPLHQVKVEADIYALNGKLLLHRDATLDAATDDVTRAMHVDLAPLMGDTTVFVHLALHAEDGALLSQNFYWRAASDAGYRALNDLAPAHVTLSAHSVSGVEPEHGRRIEVQLKNTSAVAALNTKLVTMSAADGSEILPAFYSDNYISLLPGEERTVTIDLPDANPAHALSLKIRGWNVVETAVNLTE